MTTAMAGFLVLFSASPSRAGMTLFEETVLGGVASNSEALDDRGPHPEKPDEPQAAGVEQGGSGVTVGPQTRGIPEAETRSDRRWIIKESGTTVPPASVPETVWQNEAQEARCTALVAALRSAFANARYYSIRGDACRTAQHASRFLETAEACRKDCPQWYLERSGYTKRITRNVSILLKLGEKRCKDWDVRGEEEPTTGSGNDTLPEGESVEAEKERRNVQ